MNEWGRIFFLYDEQSGDLRTAKGQPLENHVGNCVQLLRDFDVTYVDRATKALLLDAVARHDDGKRSTFKIIKRDDGTFSYSFSGHRFHVPGNDAYVDALIRSHHAFSVEQINRERAKFPINSIERRRFADDLYLLCMADQLEAELAVKSVEQTPDGSPRTFMEFVTERLEETMFTVIPWPFAPETLTLTLKLRTPSIPSFARLTDKTMQEVFEKGREFMEEQLTITLRRT